MYVRARPRGAPQVGGVGGGRNSHVYGLIARVRAAVTDIARETPPQLPREKKPPENPERFSHGSSGRFFTRAACRATVGVAQAAMRDAGRHRYRLAVYNLQKPSVQRCQR